MVPGTRPEGRRRPVIQSSMDARPRNEALSAISGLRPSTSSRCARPLPRAEERAEAGAARGARPGDRACVLNTRPRRPWSGPSAARRSRARRAERTATARGAVDVTLPGDGLPPRPAPPDHADPPRGRGRRSSASATGSSTAARSRRPQYNFDELSLPTWHPARSPLRHVLPRRTIVVLRTETSPSQIHAHGGAASRRSTWSRSAASTAATTIDATHYPIFHQFEGLAVDRGHHARRPEGHAPARDARALRRPSARCASARTTSHSPSRRSSRTSRASSAAARAAARAATRAGSRWAAPEWSTRRVFENVGVDPEEWSGFAFGCGIERVAQLRYDFPDIRPLWEGDLRVLTQF